MIILLNKNEVKKLNKGKDVGIQIRDIGKNSSVKIYNTDMNQDILGFLVDTCIRDEK